jgi:hypothetical protein
MDGVVTSPGLASSEERLWARAHSRATLLADVSTTMAGSLNVRRAALRIRQALRTASRFTRQPAELLAAADSADGPGGELAAAWIDCAGDRPVL